MSLYITAYLQKLGLVQVFLIRCSFIYIILLLYFSPVLMIFHTKRNEMFIPT